MSDGSKSKKTKTESGSGLSSRPMPLASNRTTASSTPALAADNNTTSAAASKTADSYRLEGNAAMAKHDYKRALVSYRIGLQLCNSNQQVQSAESDDKGSSDANNNSSNNTNATLAMALHSNLSLVYLKLGDYGGAIDECNAVLAQDPLNAKIWLRRACAKDLVAASAAASASSNGHKANHGRVDEQDQMEAVLELLEEAATDVERALQLLEQPTRHDNNTSSSVASNTKITNNLLRECQSLQHKLQQRRMQMQQVRRSDTRSRAAEDAALDMEVDNVRSHNYTDHVSSDSNTNMPLPQQQRQDILTLLEARCRSEPQVGEAFYLVDWRWYCHWCQYTQSDLSRFLPGGVSPPTKMEDEKSKQNGKDDSDGDEDDGIETIKARLGPPRPIDNTRLLFFSGAHAAGSQKAFYQHWYRPYFTHLARPPCGYDEAEDAKQLPLLPNLRRGYHYELLPREVYAALRCWYGESTTSIPLTGSVSSASICRRSELRGNKLVVRLYPVLQQDSLSLADNVVCHACRAYLSVARRCSRCAAVQYCSKHCQTSHWEYHKLECSPLPAMDELKRPAIRIPPRLASVGLRNLGNTCYMNATLQCLLHTTPLTRHFLSNTYRNDLNADNVMGTGGDLANFFGRTVREMQMNPQLCCGSGYSYSPLGLKRSVAKFAPRFAGFQQHDAQEFLAYLLDGLHEDLNRIKKAPYVEMPDVTEGENMDVAATRAWDLHMKRNNSLVFDCFYGQFKSTCICPNCDRISVSFEAFNHVSLEVPQKKSRPFLYSLFFFPEPALGKPPGLPVRYGFELFRSQTIADLKEALSSIAGVPTNRIILCEMVKNTIHDLLDDDKVLGSIQHDSAITAYEVDTLDKPDCFHALADHVLVTQVVNGTTHEHRNRIGFPIMVSFPCTYTCRQIWELLRNRVASLVPGCERDILQLRLHAGNLRGVPLEVFPKMLADDADCSNADSSMAADRSTKLTSIMPKESDTPLIDFVGEDAMDRFLCFWLEWTEVTNNEDSYLSRVDEDRFLEYTTHASYLEAANNQTVSDISKQGVTLDECFDSFQRAERLDEENKWYCSRCRQDVRALKTMQLMRLPNILVVHFKRFENKHTYRRDKLDTFVDFPLDGLDMTKHQAAGTEGDFIDEEMLAEYDLFGIVNHYGRMGFGHYTAFTRRFDEAGMGRWVHCDDSSVEEIEEPESIKTSAAYVLFYRRRVFT